jgi:SAM-dependent methyltransferase
MVEHNDVPYPALRSASWPFALSNELTPIEVSRLSAEVDRLGEAAPYGWGHTVDFGPFRKQGLLGEEHLRIAGGLDQWGWWPERLDGLHVADVGCFTGCLALMMAARGAEVVYAVDEIASHLDQCSFMARTFGTPQVRPILQSAYRLAGQIPPGSLDVVLLSGVIYHLSDMLVGLYAMRELLKPGGLLLVQSNGVDDFEHSYANFGRFVAGRWWQPTGLCLKDMHEFMGFEECEVRFYESQYCMARARRADGEIPFKRGMNWQFEDARDRRPRSLDAGLMAPSPHHD